MYSLACFIFVSCNTFFNIFSMRMYNEHLMCGKLVMGKALQQPSSRYLRMIACISKFCLLSDLWFLARLAILCHVKWSSGFHTHRWTSWDSCSCWLLQLVLHTTGVEHVEEILLVRRATRSRYGQYFQWIYL